MKIVKFQNIERSIQRCNVTSKIAICNSSFSSVAYTQLTGGKTMRLRLKGRIVKISKNCEGVIVRSMLLCTTSSHGRRKGAGGPCGPLDFEHFSNKRMVC